MYVCVCIYIYHIIVLLWVHCDIYQSFYNISWSNSFFFVALGFELRASCFLGRHSITWATLPVLVVKFKCSFILLYLFLLPIPGIILDLIFRLSYFFSAYANSFLKHIYHLSVYIDLLSYCTKLVLSFFILSSYTHAIYFNITHSLSFLFSSPTYSSILSLSRVSITITLCLFPPVFVCQ
jgi:hypothetical protein